MDTASRHLLCEYWGCDQALLNDEARLEQVMRRAAQAADATPVGAVFHRLAPQGVSGVLVLEESHFSLHTWPESGYAAVDLFTCGDCRPDQAHLVLVEALRAERAEVMILARGGHPPGPAIRVLHHDAPCGDRVARARGSTSVRASDES